MVRSLQVEAARSDENLAWQTWSPEFTHQPCSVHVGLTVLDRLVHSHTPDNKTGPGEGYAANNQGQPNKEVVGPSLGPCLSSHNAPHALRQRPQVAQQRALRQDACHGSKLNGHTLTLKGGLCASV